MVDTVLERLPELLEQRHPFLFAARDRVELVLEPRRKVVVDVLREVVGQKFIDDAADVGREEPFLVELDIIAILQRRDDRRIGRRPADAVLLERFDQAGLAVARRRFGEMLFRADLL